MGAGISIQGSTTSHFCPSMDSVRDIWNPEPRQKTEYKSGATGMKDAKLYLNLRMRGPISNT